MKLSTSLPLQQPEPHAGVNWNAGEVRNDSVVVKPWGESQTLVCNPSVQIEMIRVKRGGFSSPHDHVAKHNLFLVIQGRLQVTRFVHDSASLRESARDVLTSDDQALIVDAQETHQFLCLEDCVAIEVYWPTSGNALDRYDIRRYGVNGLREQAYTESW